MPTISNERERANAQAQMQVEAGRQLIEAREQFTLSSERLAELTKTHWERTGAKVERLPGGEVQATETVTLNAAAIAGLGATYPEADAYIDNRLTRIQNLLHRAFFVRDLATLTQVIGDFYQEAVALGFAAGRVSEADVERGKTLSAAAGAYTQYRQQQEFREMLDGGQLADLAAAANKEKKTRVM